MIEHISKLTFIFLTQLYTSKINHTSTSYKPVWRVTITVCLTFGKNGLIMLDLFLFLVLTMLLSKQYLEHMGESAAFCFSTWPLLCRGKICSLLVIRSFTKLEGHVNIDVAALWSLDRILKNSLVENESDQNSPCLWSASVHTFLQKGVNDSVLFPINFLCIKVFTFKGDIKNSTFSFLSYLCEEASPLIIKFWDSELRQKQEMICF